MGIGDGALFCQVHRIQNHRHISRALPSHKEEINLNIDGCGVVAPRVHSSSRAPLLLANLLAHSLPLPRAAQ